MAQANYQRLYLVKYKNYYDRLATTEVAIDILDKAQLVESISDYNFNPNDGVNTEIVVNRSLSHAADYLLVQDQQSGEFLSNWYIMDCKRNLKGQETLLLRRDVLQDYMSDWMNAKSFVEKGTVQDTDDAIFNSEGMSYNQIKVREEPLTDEYNCQWLVGYYDKKSRSEIVGTDLTLNPDADIVVNALSDWDFAPLVGNTTGAFLYDIDEWAVETSVLLPSGESQGWKFYSKSQILQKVKSYDSDYRRSMRYYGGGSAATIEQTRANYQAEMGSILAAIRQGRGTFVENGILSQEDSLIVQSLNGKILKAGSIYYRINVNYQSVERIFNFVQGAVDVLAVDKVFESWSHLALGDYCYFTIKGRIFTISLSEYKSTSEKYSYDIGTDIANYSTDAEYGVFAIPYTDEAIGAEFFNKEVSMMVANHMLQNHSTQIYDIQLLPFAPAGIRIEDADSKAISYIKNSSGTAVCTIFHIQNINTTKIINYTENIENYKVENETQFCRLLSPNYQSAYEFTPAKNGGIKYFTVDMTLKPYSPYIHVRPNTGRLYGTDYGDATGLICAGDFSLTRVTDKWSEYELQNKNYEKQFDRQIENLEVQQNVQRTQEPWSVMAGALQAGTTGALVGGAGGPIGAAVGAVVGTGASLAAGIADMSLNEKLRNEAIDFSKDNFQMQMQNIRALPRTLNKVDTINANNKKFVVLEYYSATEQEKSALAWKIVMEGMTINRIGSFADYVNHYVYVGADRIENIDMDFNIYPFVRGKIIKFKNDFVGDYHIAKAIAEEVAKGVYVLWE